MAIMAKGTKQFRQEVVAVLPEQYDRPPFVRASSKKGANERISRIRGILSRMTIEPAIFLYTFAFLLSVPVFGSMMKQTLCLQHFGFTTEECQAFGRGKNMTVDTSVQKIWAKYDNYAAVFSTVPGMLFALLMGPWSDTFGRKPLLAAPFIGVVLANIFTIMLYLLPSLPLWMLFLPSLMLGLTGSFIALIAGAYAYAADLSAKDGSRTIRNTVIEICATSGYSLAGILSGVLNGAKVEAFVFYVTALTAAVIAFVYIVVRVRETRHPDQDFTTAETIIQVFKIKHFVDTCKTVARKRFGRARLCLCLLILAFAIYNVTLSGEEATNQKFFLASPLSWSLSYYMYFQAGWGLANMLVVLVFVLLAKKRLRVADATLGALGCVSRIGFGLVFGFACATWMAYLANAVGILKFVSAIAMRTLMSKLVSEDEQGKLLSLLAAFEGASPLMGSVLVTPIFTSTVDWWPGFYSFAGAASTLIPLVLLVFVGHYVRQDARRRTQEALRRASMLTTDTEAEQ